MCATVCVLVSDWWLCPAAPRLNRSNCLSCWPPGCHRAPLLASRPPVLLLGPAPPKRALRACALLASRFSRMRRHHQHGACNQWPQHGHGAPEQPGAPQMFSPDHVLSCLNLCRQLSRGGASRLQAASGPPPHTHAPLTTAPPAATPQCLLEPSLYIPVEQLCLNFLLALPTAPRRRSNALPSMPALPPCNAQRAG
ncbi:MAG: hypothetical protein J3K34DRAFT_520999, partial [Monoraphidium minutum]